MVQKRSQKLTNPFVDLLKVRRGKQRVSDLASGCLGDVDNLFPPDSSCLSWKPNMDQIWTNTISVNKRFNKSLLTKAFADLSKSPYLSMFVQDNVVMVDRSAFADERVIE